jgi:hypothetical protein
MGWSTSLRGAISALVQAATGAPELDGVVVRDGPAVENTDELTVLYIGWTGGTGDTDAETSIQPEGLQGNPDREQAVIRCTAWVMSGSGTVADVRERAYDIVSGLGAVIDRNRTLNKTVMRAAIGNHSLSQQQTTGGAQAVITFEVDTDAYTVR